MSGKTDVQFFYVVVTTNENPGSNQSLASVRVLFDGGTDRLPPCRTGANTFCIVATRFRMHTNTFCTLQHDFVRMQTCFAPCNTISYACKHVLHRCNNSFGGQNGLLHRCNNSFGGQNGLLHRCSKRFGGRNDRYIAAANDSGVEMTVTLLQQLIRWAERAFTSLQHSITAM